MHWQIQFARNVVASHLPGYEALRRLKRRRGSYAPDLSNFGSTIHDLDRQLALLRNAGLDPADRTVLEVGSGWFPLIPLLYRCLGARQVVMTDISPHMDAGTLETARRFVLDNLPALAQRLGFAPEQPWLRAGRSLQDLGLSYRAPFDPAGAELQVDVITSRTVLEHIAPDVLRRLSTDWHGLLAPGGVMVHAIDHSDHREHQDKRLSRIDFLTYSEGAWNVITRLGHRQWRLRHSDYRRLFAETGWAVAAEEVYAEERVLEDARRLPLKPPFDTGYPPEELAIVASYLLLVPAAAPAGAVEA